MKENNIKQKGYGMSYLEGLLFSSSATCNANKEMLTTTTNCLNHPITKLKEIKSNNKDKLYMILSAMTRVCCRLPTTYTLITIKWINSHWDSSKQSMNTSHILISLRHAYENKVLHSHELERWARLSAVPQVWRALAPYLIHYFIKSFWHLIVILLQMKLHPQNNNLMSSWMCGVKDED